MRKHNVNNKYHMKPECSSNCVYKQRKCVNDFFKFYDNFIFFY